MNHHFFDKLYSELAFSPTTSAIQETINTLNPSHSTHILYRNMTSGETLEGSFFLEKGLLIHFQGNPKIILDLSYARLLATSQCNQKRKIQLSKNQNLYEMMFDDRKAYDDWMIKLKKICVFTNFEKKYQIAEVTKKREDRCECLLETSMGGNHFSARRFYKEKITSLAMIRLMNEIEILRVLRKKRVLHLHEVHETEDSIYLVTDCIHNNTTLKEILKAEPAPLNPSQTKTIMHQLLKILAHLASKNIAHRNIKPSSILVEDTNHLRIVNFGLATFINSPKANVGICGTPGYIAPEILNPQESRVYDDKIDMFSAGCIFFEMLFGKPLFESSKIFEISTLNKNFDYSQLVHFVINENTQSPPPSIKLLLKLLHNDPKQRISAQEALRDVYFKSQENSSYSEDSSDDESETPSQIVSNRKRVSFDLSPSFSEADSHQESSTLYPSKISQRRASEDHSGKCTFLSLFKNQPKFKSEGEMKSSCIRKRFSQNLMMQKIKDEQNEEDSSSIFVFDEGSLSLTKNCPLASPEMKRHPNQKRI